MSGRLVTQGSITIMDFSDAIISSTPPSDPFENMLWLDTSQNPPVQKIYKYIYDDDGNVIGGEWVDLSETSPIPPGIAFGGYLTAKVTISTTSKNIIEITSGYFSNNKVSKTLITNSCTIATQLKSNKGQKRFLIFTNGDSSVNYTSTTGTNACFIIGVYKGGKWYYESGDNLVQFTPKEDYCNVGKLLEYDSSTTNKGIKEIIMYSENAESLFDLLTGNGERQGLFKSEDGKIFICSEYIDTRNFTARDDSGNETFKITDKGLVEIIQGLISISEKGITINLIDSENNILGYALFDGQGMQLFTNAGDAIAYFTAEGSYVNTLVANHIQCDEIVKDSKASGCPKDWYIASEATGDATGKDEDNKSDSLKDVFNSIKSYGSFLTESLNVYIEEGCNMEESVSVENLLGSEIIINVATGVVLNILKFDTKNVTTKIRFKASTTDDCLATSATTTTIAARPLITTTSTDCIFSTDGGLLQFEGFRIAGNDTQDFVKAKETAFVLTNNCDIKGFSYIVNGSMGCNLSVTNCRGNVKQLGRVYQGSIFTSTVNIPKCTLSPIVDRQLSGIWIQESSYVQADTLQGTSSSGGGSTGGGGTGGGTTTVITNKTERFTATNLYTKVEGTGIYTSSKNGCTGQGKWQSYKPHRGHIILPTTSILTSLKSRKNYTMKLRMTRLNTGHGYAGAVPHPIIRAVGSKTGTTSAFWDSSVKFARGDTKTITLPTSITDAIAAGATELQLWAASSQDLQYSFYNNVVLIIEGDVITTVTGGGSSGGTTEPDPDPDVGEGETSLKATGKATQQLNVRSGPGTSYNYVGLLAAGETAEIVAVHTASGWYKIKWKTGYAYVSNKYITIVS